MVSATKTANESTSALVPDGVQVCADGRVKYPEPYEAYESVYGRKARSIRELVKIGKRVGELPPLQDPAEMPAWWGRHMKQQVPESIIRASRGVPARDVALELESCVSADSDSDKDSFESIDIDLVEAGGAAESYERSAKLEALAYQRLAEEMKKPHPDPKEVDYWATRHKNQQLARRQWEKDINNIRKERGELLEKQHLVGELVSLAGSIARNIDRAFSLLIDEIAPVEMPEKARRALAIEHRDRCFAELRETEFSAALQSHDS